MDSLNNRLKPWQQVALLWLAWALVLNAVQAFLIRRLELVRPDPLFWWTAAYSRPDFLESLPARGGFWKFYGDPHVAWDSNYYLSIALAGYDDPRMETVAAASGEELSLNYAFMPFYPFLIRSGTAAFRLLGLPVERTLIPAAVLISLLGTLAGALALADLARQAGYPQLEPVAAAANVPVAAADHGLRAVFYLLIFPSAFFLAQVYTEGLFVGLAFGCLALLVRRQWLWAGLLSAAAFFTRTAGIGLVLPLGVAAVWDTWKDQRFGRLAPRTLLVRSAALLLPLAALLGWQFSPLGQKFALVQDAYFSRQLFALVESWQNWSQILSGLVAGALTVRQAVYFSLETASVILAALACLAALRRYPLAALFSGFVLASAVTSGYPQSMIRYVLTAPALFLFLGSLGRSRVFDRVWTLACSLLLAVLLALFSFDLWVG
jgi:hypothetical protein